MKPIDADATVFQPTLARAIALAAWLLVALPAQAGEATPPPPQDGTFESDNTRSGADEPEQETQTDEEAGAEDGDSRAPGTFVASEQIRVDKALPLPVDI